MHGFKKADTFRMHSMGSSESLPKNNEVKIEQSPIVPKTLLAKTLKNAKQLDALKKKLNHMLSKPPTGAGS